ncbi:MAG: hypothetical protein HY326_14245, partial [Chloroflexi bacterium]|nr:hypothetical protein [Chloroflexota bacterium]
MSEKQPQPDISRRDDVIGQADYTPAAAPLQKVEDVARALAETHTISRHPVYTPPLLDRP